jgi:TldD protein
VPTPHTPATAADRIDPAFAGLPLRALADAALSRADALGASYAGLRVESVTTQRLGLRDAKLEGSEQDTDTGLSVRVVHDGTWGFAAGVVTTPDEAARLADAAVAVARTCKPVNSEPVELADEPVHGEQVWVSAYRVDPFDVPEADKIELLAAWSDRLLAADAVKHVRARLTAVREHKYYADLVGNSITQQRVRIAPELDAIAIADDGTFETMSLLAPPAGRGWEYLLDDAEAGVPGAWHWQRELRDLPELLAEKLRAPSVDPGRYDLVVDSTNLWLTIHESIGHATELDRALGYEAAYAGTSFATLDKLGSLRYGSPLLNVTGDRIVEHGLSTIGFDDEGVRTQSWDLISNGVLVGYQLDRAMARRENLNGGRSNGCAFADSPSSVPIQRMANVSLLPAPDGPSTEGLIAGVEDGIYVVGDKSWSIDMQRYNFQFTGQRFYRIRGGRLVGQLRDVAYQATTTDFWGAMEAVGGPDSYVLNGAINCGKGQPGQVAAVSHGTPAAMFRGVRILNTVQEAGR